MDHPLCYPIHDECLYKNLVSTSQLFRFSGHDPPDIVQRVYHSSKRRRDRSKRKTVFSNEFQHYLALFGSCRGIGGILAADFLGAEALVHAFLKKKND